MGWKTFKKHFEIEHLVTVHDETIYIGSPYVSDLVRVNMKTGVCTENSTFSNFLDENYPKLKQASPEEVIKTILKKDKFNDSLKVYTYKDGLIVEKLCEERGYPNVTHDGYLMYENTFSDTREGAAKMMLRDAVAGVRLLSSTISSLEKDIREASEELKLCENAISNAYNEFPHLQE